MESNLKRIGMGRALGGAVGEIPTTTAKGERRFGGSLPPPDSGRAAA